MLLTRSNYHSLEARNAYMSNSDFKMFLDCEAQAVASLRGEYVRERTTAMLVGSYVDAWVSGDLEAFKRDPANNDIFTQKGDLKAEFKLADAMIDAIRTDTNAMIALQGQKQTIFTADFAGMPWRVMLDVFHPDRYAYIEFKTTKSIWESDWNPLLKRRESFVESYNYPRQMAICSEIVRRSLGRDEWPEALILAVSKEAPPDKILLDMGDAARFVQELHEIEVAMPRVIGLREGRQEPVRCEKCAYCRATKKITMAFHYRVLDPE